MDRYYDGDNIPYPSLENMKSLQRLHDLKGLISLGVAISSRERRHFAELQRAVFSCPHLQSLTVYALGKVYGHQYPYLLTEYPWDGEQEGKLQFPMLTKLELHNFCICMEHQGRWQYSFNWPMLTDAAFTCASFITTLGDRLTGLRFLKLHLKSPSYSGAGCSDQVNREDIKNITQLRKSSVNNKFDQP